ncbi:MAG TPA: tandem-95 repeat protein [Pseudolabrys sp.]|nr:tandem-95 repeat protein [Pseudolabrys sp.]
MVQKIGTSANEDLIGTSGNDLLDGRIGTHRMYGMAGDDQLLGGSGNDVLDGGVGQDVMTGGMGDDLYRVDNINDVVTELNGEGVDTVEASISYTLGDFVEKLALTGTASINGTGNDLGNRIKGNDAANVLIGNGGADTISGGGGNDLIIGGTGKDTVDGGAGADTFQLSGPSADNSDRILDFVASEDRIAVLSSDYGLREGRGMISGSLDPSYFAVITGTALGQGTVSGHGQFLYNSTTLTLTWDKDGAGTAYSGEIIATFAADPQLSATNFTIIDDGASNSAPVAPASTSFVTKMNAPSAAMSINATDPDGDPLTYAIKDNFAPAHGTVTFDQTLGTYTYTPQNNYLGTDSFTIKISDQFGASTEEAVSLTVQQFDPTLNQKIGTSANEDLIGTPGNDLLDGRIGTHRMYGMAGDDQLLGGSGNDVLDGGVGQDVMTGGMGDDLYRVDNINDVVTELSGGGVDTVEATISYTLGDFVEKLALTGTASINGTGNDLDNRIKGNNAANVLVGSGGSDIISGGGGNDYIIGGLGKDYLDGGAGADTFQLSGPTFADADRITDFSALEDRIAVLASDYGLREGRGSISGSLDPSYFAAISGKGVEFQGTVSGHGQFLYNSTTFTLMWDKDGAGPAFVGETIATFPTDVQLTAANFTIVDNNVGNSAPVTPASMSFVTKMNIHSAAMNINAVDANGDPLTYAVKDNFGPTHGSVTFDPVVGTLTYTPDANYTGADAFTITASDGFGGTAEEAVSLTVQQYDPVPISTPTLVNATDTRLGFGADIGAVDPAGIVWVPANNGHPGTLFLSDSEVDEPPYNSPNNLFALNTDGTPQGDAFRFNIENFTKEPTGLAYNPLNGYMYISDDDLDKIFWVDPNNPTVKLGEFATRPIGGTDPEDIAINPNNGNIFISNGVPSHTIVEVTSTGTPVSITTVPDVVKDMEALAYDPQHDVFFVGGGFSSNIWVVDRAGTILDTIDLSAYRNPVSGTHVAVKDIAFAPTSNPNDDPSQMNLYVADYGLTHLPNDNDGRVLEVNLGWHLTA